jgi:two-component system, NtrC family, response regulator AtoC
MPMVDQAERRKPPRSQPGPNDRWPRPCVMAIGADPEFVRLLRRLALERGMRWAACRTIPPGGGRPAGKRCPDLVFVLDDAALAQLPALRKDAREVVLVLDPDRPIDRESIQHVDIAVLCRPLDPRFVARLLDEVVEESRRQVVRRDPASEPTRQLQRFGGLEGASATMRRLFAHMQRMAGSSASVLIYGERGTGKARAALALHQASRCAASTFVAIDGRDGLSLQDESAAACPPSRSSLLPERIEAARGGTLFINHVNDLAPHLQIPLLRALNGPPFSRSPGPAAVRLVAALDRDPLSAIRAGRLRQDLYLRLAQFVLRMPPLRERGRDVVDLAHLLLRERNEQCGTDKALSQEAVEAMCRHPWPGNVGELKNVIEHAHARAGQVIGGEDLPSAVGRSDTFPDREAGEFRDIV